MTNTSRKFFVEIGRRSVYFTINAHEYTWLPICQRKVNTEIMRKKSKQDVNNNE